MNMDNEAFDLSIPFDVLGDASGDVLGDAPRGVLGDALRDAQGSALGSAQGGAQWGAQGGSEPFDLDDPSLPEGFVVGKVERIARPLADWQNPELDAVQRIRSLVDSMPGHSKVLFGILEFCQERRSPASVDQKVAELQGSSAVYTPIVLRKLLEQAGALVYLEEGQRDMKAQEAAPADTLVVTSRPEGKWLTTIAGTITLDTQNPLADLSDLLEDNPAYIQLYLRVLRACKVEPQTALEIDRLVEDDPLVQEPRRYGGYFIDHLFKYKAIDFVDKWHITEAGLAVLAKFDEKEQQ